MTLLPSLTRLRRLVRDERGQVLPMVAVLMVALLGMAALALDTGHSMYGYRELQSTTDAAALAAARAIPTASSAGAITGPNGVVEQYSSKSGAINARPGLPNVTVTSTLECLTTIQAQGIACIGKVPYNAIQVTQTMTLPMYFAGVLGHPTQTIRTISTAAVRGGSPRPSNIAIILDTSLSMAQYDGDCLQTRMQCALNGVQTLLQHLSPCGIYESKCANGNGQKSQGAIKNPFDQVALFAFPDVTIGTTGIDTGCTTPIPNPTPQNGFYYVYPYGNLSMLPTPAWGGVPTDVAYSFPTPGASSYSPNGSNTATYQITSFLADYRVSDTAATLNPQSDLVQAAGGVSGCGAMGPANYDGEYGTYYAGAIYAAQAALTSQKAQYPSTDNVIIILGDGDSTAPQTNNGYTVMGSPANASGTYPSWAGECGQAITAAKSATAAGTLVYTVAYGSSSVGCASDVSAGAYPYISPCDTMAGMASAPQYFYSDYKQTNSLSTCTSAQPAVSLAGIFAAIAADLSQARLIPNNTT